MAEGKGPPTCCLWLKRGAREGGREGRGEGPRTLRSLMFEIDPKGNMTLVGLGLRMIDLWERTGS